MVYLVLCLPAGLSLSPSVTNRLPRRFFLLCISWVWESGLWFSLNKVDIPLGTYRRSHLFWATSLCSCCYSDGMGLAFSGFEQTRKTDACVSHRQAHNHILTFWYWVV